MGAGSLRVQRVLGLLLRACLLAAGLAVIGGSLAGSALLEAQGRLDQARSLLDVAADAAQTRVTELLTRFDRATGSVRAQDLQGDGTALSIRLLRAEPVVAPAAGLVAINIRGRQVAGTSPAAASDDMMLSWVSTALPAEQRGAALLSLPGQAPGFVLARRIEDAQRNLAGVVLSTLSADAVRAAIAPPRPLAGLMDVVLTDRDGRELLRAGRDAGAAASPAANANGPDWLGARWLGLLGGLVPPAWVPPQRATADVPAGNLRWSATLDAAAIGMADRPVRLWLFLGSLAGCALVVVALVMRPSSPPAGSTAGAAVVPGEIEDLRRQLDEAGERRNRVLAAIGHDVRTPISSILGISALLMDGDLDEGQRKWLQRIRASCDALLAMLNGMLEIAAANMDGAEVHAEPVDVATLVEEVGEVLRPQAHDKGLELRISIGAEALGLWNTDPTRLRQVLFNLAGNAVKYTFHGSVELEVLAIRGPDGPERLHFRVVDTGPGIPEADHGRIFEQFCRGSDAATRGQEGLGLGLALCREIAALLGGTLTLQSTAGAGSVFTFELPAQRVRRLEGASAPMAGRTALVVGLSEGVRRRTASHLERLGFDVETAADGFIALGLAERATFEHGGLDLAVLDAALAGLTADALAARLQAGPSGARLRVALVTNEASAVLAQGRADALLPHPVEAQAIERAVIGLFGSTSVLQEVDPRATVPDGLRVLVVEDNRINQALFLDVLARAGFSAFAASSGEEAVTAAARGGFDVILMDVQMPGIDGIEATRRIRAAERGRRTPVVALTAHTGASIRRRCLDAAMDSILHKPVDLSRLPLRLREAVAANAMPPTADRQAGPEPLATLDIADEYLEALVQQVGVERARSCINDFLLQAGAQLPKLKTLVDADKTALGQLAHDLAGVSGTLGVTGLLDGLLLVEDSARKGDTAQAHRAVDEVLKTWGRVQPALSARFEAVAAKLGGPDLRKVA